MRHHQLLTWMRESNLDEDFEGGGEKGNNFFMQSFKGRNKTVILKIP